MPRVHALDGLRLWCCVAVIVGHAAWGSVASKLASFGVDVFFALRGYLITTLLLRARAGLGVNLRAFYIRRARRILPAYYAALVLAALLTWLLGSLFSDPFRGPADARFFTTTLPLYFAFVGNWTNASVPSVLDVLWSVCIEEQFYILFPPTIAIGARRWPVVFPVTIVLLCAWACRIWLASRADPTLYRNTLAHADGLLLGALLAQLVEMPRSRLREWVAAHAAEVEVAAIALAAALLILRRGDSPFAYWATYLASAVCAVLLVLAFAIGRGPVARVLAWRPLAWLGTLTYVAYLFHMYAVTAAFGITRRLRLGEAEVPIRIALALAITFPIAYVAHVAIERPFLRRKRE